jgi:hypothetical protein
MIQQDDTAKVCFQREYQIWLIDVQAALQNKSSGNHSVEEFMLDVRGYFERYKCMSPINVAAEDAHTTFSLSCSRYAMA